MISGRLYRKMDKARMPYWIVKKMIDDPDINIEYVENLSNALIKNNKEIKRLIPNKFEIFLSGLKETLHKFTNVEAEK